MADEASNPGTPELVIVGSIGIDTIETPVEKQNSILGGSVSYACAAASFFTGTGMVGVVGSDFPDEYTALFHRFGIDMDGLQRVDGETFRWSGVYEEDMNSRRTLSTDLNVFADFSPELPDAYRSAEFVLLGNISPNLQLHVLDQVKQPRLVMADTMDLWINNTRDDLQKVIERVDILTLNDSEARLLTGTGNVVQAAEKILAMGPGSVIIKKGEHGAILFTGDGIVITPAYPLANVVDPTGAGDSFAGAFMGSVARDGDVDGGVLRQAMLYGSTVASFGVQAFGLERFKSLSEDDITHRGEELAGMVSCD
ncbi:MAG: PfkB family carbohydrate kinase [Verrucomicrobia bacterium]|nr:PfkB family carbohydrate kinase [Verrucomicrobiota bacterium]MDA1086083.1 PfkB family carbohydrate kinase [Verrucomicrobiota bacterium]